MFMEQPGEFFLKLPFNSVHILYSRKKASSSISEMETNFIFTIKMYLSRKAIKN